MNWLEIIELRSAGFDKGTVEKQLEKLLGEFEKNMVGKGIKSYRRVSVDSDFSIHLLHETEQIETWGSELGLRLVSALREFGMINHTIWKETRCI
jgi:hypothetical protein